MAIPQSLGEGQQITNFDHCLHIVIVNYEVYGRFEGEFFALGCGDGSRGEGYMGGSFHGEMFMREDNFHEGGAGFSRIIKKNEKINQFLTASMEQH